MTNKGVTFTTTASPGALTFTHSGPVWIHITLRNPCRGVRKQQLHMNLFFRRAVPPNISWPSPVEPNRTSPIYPRRWLRQHISCYLCVQSDNWARGEQRLSAWSLVPHAQRALWDMAELFVLLHTGASWRNVAIPVLLRTIRDRKPFNLLFAFPAISCGLPVQPPSFAWMKMSLFLPLLYILKK